MANKRAITAQLAEFRKAPPPGCTAEPASEANIENWTVKVVGPAGSPYAGGTFTLKVTFPAEFPRKGPTINFATKIWHPLVNPDGQFCLPILSDWVVSQKLVNVFKTLVEALTHPTADHAANAAVAEELLGDPPKFVQTATAWTRQYAT
jgi:ubiquitin-conjugating enzyme E2 D/E